MGKFYLAISFHVLATENLAIQFFVVVWCFWKSRDCFLEIWNPSQTVAWKISLVFRWDEWGCRLAAENISMVYLPLYVSNCWSLCVWVIYSTPIIDHFTIFSWHPFLVNELILRSIITWNVTCDTCSLSCVSLAYRCEVDKCNFRKQMWKQENMLAWRHDGISPGSKVLFEDEVWTWGQATGNGWRPKEKIKWYQGILSSVAFISSIDTKNRLILPLGLSIERMMLFVHFNHWLNYCVVSGCES